MGKVYYVRHGQASLFADNYDQLSKKGYHQAQAVGTFFSQEKIDFDRIYAGPLQRHHQTIDGIRTTMNKKQPETEILHGLKEHEGYSALKTLLPGLIANDASIRKLVNIPWNDRKEQIKHHMRIFEHFSSRWITGEFDALSNSNHQSWSDFLKGAKDGLQQVRKQARQGENILVVTSGGPKAVACGEALDLDSDKILHTSWVIFNASVSEFLYGNNRFTLSTFNNVSFIRKKEWRTLV